MPHAAVFMNRTTGEKQTFTSKPKSVRAGWRQSFTIRVPASNHSDELYPDLIESGAPRPLEPALAPNLNIHDSGADPVQEFLLATRATLLRTTGLTKSRAAPPPPWGSGAIRSADVRMHQTAAITGRYELIRHSANTTGLKRPTRAPGTPLVGREHAHPGGASSEIKQGPSTLRRQRSCPWAPPEGHESVPAFQQWAVAAQRRKRSYEPGAAAFERRCSGSFRRSCTGVRLKQTGWTPRHSNTIDLVAGVPQLPPWTMKAGGHWSAKN